VSDPKVGSLLLVQYASPDAPSPVSVAVLHPRGFTISPPKSKRSMPNTFVIRVTAEAAAQAQAQAQAATAETEAAAASGGGCGSDKWVLAAQKADEMSGWRGALSRWSTGEGEGDPQRTLRATAAAELVALPHRVAPDGQLDAAAVRTLRGMPASALTVVALKAGHLRKERARKIVKSASFDLRWFTFVRADAVGITHIPVTVIGATGQRSYLSDPRDLGWLVWFKTPEAKVAEGIQTLVKGMCTCQYPKKLRKGYPFCFRVDGLGIFKGAKLVSKQASTHAGGGSPHCAGGVCVWRDGDTGFGGRCGWRCGRLDQRTG
jgi:hypothetical protein